MSAKMNENILDILDKTILICPEFGIFNINEIIRKSCAEGKDYNNLNEVSEILKELKILINDHPMSGVYRLTPLGREMLNAGGYQKYVKNQNDEKEFERIRKVIEHESNLSTIKLNKYLHKTRWLPHILALIATIISILALCYSIEA